LGEPVFMFGSCCPYCDFFFQVYNCAGEVVHTVQPVTDLKIIWKPWNSACSF
jgi:hypothetical protein